MSGFSDYKVRPRSYDKVAGIAKHARDHLASTRVSTVNLADIFEKYRGREFQTSGVLTITLFDDKSPPISCKKIPSGPLPPAFVQFKPLTLFVHSEIWNEAVIGVPDANFILAHELGHILMHDDVGLAFSRDERKYLKAFGEESSAENQANWFAAYFLAPDNIVQSCKTARELYQACEYPENYAELRLDLLARTKKSQFRELCSYCGNFTLERINTIMKCNHCNTTSKI